MQLLKKKQCSAYNNIQKICNIPVHDTSPSPSKPDLHLQRKCAGKLQHSAFFTHRAAMAGSSHSLISVKQN